MRELRALTQEEFARAEFRLRNPTPGGRIEAAKEYGIGLKSLFRSKRAVAREKDVTVLRELEGLLEAEEPE